jgi:hypothetical protein
MQLGQASSILFLSPDNNTDDQTWEEVLLEGNTSEGNLPTISDGDRLLLETTDALIAYTDGTKGILLGLERVGGLGVVKLLLGRFLNTTGLQDVTTGTIFGTQGGDGSNNGIQILAIGQNGSQLSIKITDDHVATIETSDFAGTAPQTTDQVWKLPQPAVAGDGVIALREWVESQTKYTEEFGATFNSVGSGAWETINVPGAGANKLVQILVTNTSGAARQGGVREVGSALNRLGATNSDSYVGTTRTDASGDIQVYAQVNTDIDFNLYATIG